ncbi:hypothetical protein FB565_007114 [Actinoplanes lutulentus]|uniref:Uncharacterized protein n=1 Tax=Actinoplanes lutulentus TaxID=1287878 RepID=A0A327ZBE7_9ACTN|nr:hypothetical protein [Actinoplanes lutulentus]MBB2947346.1 hypothetical protein [Actinoplanes lutulentus]RAK36621.1 hypothetical protein B0I29_108211 [Actinoplanes lutulentus]
MSSTTGTARHDAAVSQDRTRRSLETKPAFKTTEFIAYVVAVLGVLIASLIVDGNGNGDNGAGGDYFRADRAWFYVVLLTIGYMASRGLAKAGSRDSADA